MTQIFYCFLPYLVFHTYTDFKDFKTYNKINLTALIALIYFSRGNYKLVITALLFSLVSGLYLERLGVWAPGDTRMFSICAGYVSLLGVPMGLYVGTTMVGYAITSIILLAAKKQLGIPNPMAILQPLLRDKGVHFPGAPLIAASSIISWGVTVWKFF